MIYLAGLTLVSIASSGDKPYLGLLPAIFYTAGISSLEPENWALAGFIAGFFGIWISKFLYAMKG